MRDVDAVRRDWIARLRRIRGRDEERIGLRDQPERCGIEVFGALNTDVSSGPALDPVRLARLDVLRAVPEALHDRHREAVLADFGHHAVEPIAPAGVRLDAEQADAGAGTKRSRER